MTELDPRSLARELRSLHGAMNRLAAFLSAFVGIQAALLVGRLGLPKDGRLVLAGAFGGTGLAIVSVAWVLAQGQVDRWMTRVDTTLGPGAGQALLRLGRLPLNAFDPVPGLPVMAEGLIELAASYPSAAWLDEPATGTWAATAVLGASVWAQSNPALALVLGAVTLVTLQGASRLGPARKKG